MLKDQALRFRLSADPRLYAWTWGFLKECTAAKARRNTLLKHRLAAYSQTVLDQRRRRRRRSTTTATPAASSTSTADQKALDAGVEHMKLLESDGQAIKVLDPRPGDRARAGLGPRQGEDRRRHPLPDRRDRGLRQIHPRARRQDRRTRRRDRHRRDRRQAQDRRRQGDASLDRPRPVRRRRLCAGARRREPHSRPRAWHPPAHLSDQGLFADHSDRRREVAADDRLSRRAQPRRHFALRRPPADHRDRGIRRLRREPQAVRLRLHEAGDAGALSRRRRVRPGGNVGGPSGR